MTVAVLEKIVSIILLNEDKAHILFDNFITLINRI